MRKLAINAASLATLLMPALAFAQGNALVGVVQNLANLLLGILLATAVIFLIVAAFNFLFARGDEGKLAEARKAVLWSLVAVALGVAARFLVGFAASLVPK